MDATFFSAVCSSLPLPEHISPDKDSPPSISQLLAVSVFNTHTEKRKQLEYHIPAEFITLPRISPLSFLSQTPFPVMLSLLVASSPHQMLFVFSPLTSITWDVWVASDVALSSVSELADRH